MKHQKQVMSLRNIESIFAVEGIFLKSTAAKEKSVNIDELLQELTTVYENSDSMKM